MDVLVTGGAGFIGSHLCESLLAQGHGVVAIDNFDSGYDAAVKRRNIERLKAREEFRLIEADIRDLEAVEDGLQRVGIQQPYAVVHLAARESARPTVNVVDDADVNVCGTLAVLELARRRGIRRFLFASSAAVYGNNSKVPFAETDRVDEPLSTPAATKRAGELLCHAYHHLHGLSVVCLRLFSVYGPRQRPDLAIHKFARLMREGRPIPMYGAGLTERDYTYVTDVIRGIEAALDYTGRLRPVFEIINLGGSQTTTLERLVSLLAKEMAVQPSLQRLPEQPGDVERTCADVGKARRLLGYVPTVPLEHGIPRFVEWFVDEPLAAEREITDPEPTIDPIIPPGGGGSA